jgi:predicted nucleic acid-binding protein
MIVVDTNVISYIFLPSQELTTTAQQIFRKDSHWAAPLLWRSEFRNVLALYMRRQQMSLVEAKIIMRDAEAMMTGFEHTIASATVISLVDNSSCSAYDCEFVALAQDLNVPLVTFDKKILAEFEGTAVSPQQFLTNC